MRIAATLTTLLMTSTLALAGCDSDDDDSSSSGGSGGDARAADILAMPGDSAAGQTVFIASCGIASCHEPDGSGGDTVMPLSTLVPMRNDDMIVAVLLNGLGAMPPQANLSDAQLADVTAYLNVTFAP